MRLTSQQLLFALVCSFLMSFSPLATAQKTKPSIAPGEVSLRVEMKDGSVFVGRRLAMTADELIIDTEVLGKINLPLGSIREIREIQGDGASGNAFGFENIAAHQNTIGPNAYGLRRGQKQYSNFMLGFNQIAFGITDKFSLHAGLEVFSVLAGISSGEFFGPGFLLRPHFSFPVKADKLTIGGGLALAGVPGTGDGLFAAAPYIAFGIGNRDRNVNTTVGVGFAGGSFSPPFFSLNGNLRLSRGFGLMTENWIIADSFSTGVITTAGVRLFGERLVWSISLAATGFDGEFFVLPIPLGGVTASF